MKEGKKRNKPAASGVITLACALALGAGAGWLGAWAADRVDFSPLLLAGTLVLAAAGMMGQIILHEAGHLLGALPPAMPLCRSGWAAGCCSSGTAACTWAATPCRAPGASA